MHQNDALTLDLGTIHYKVQAGQWVTKGRVSGPQIATDRGKLGERSRSDEEEDREGSQKAEAQEGDHQRLESEEGW